MVVTRYASVSAIRVNHLVIEVHSGNRMARFAGNILDIAKISANHLILIFQRRTPLQGVATIGLSLCRRSNHDSFPDGGLGKAVAMVGVERTLCDTGFSSTKMPSQPKG